MRNLIQIREGAARVEDDAWEIVTDLDAARAHAHPVIALKLALAEPAAVSALARFGLLLAPDDAAHDAAPWLDRAGLIAIDFPAFADGRGYSTAVLLRTRLGWTGDLRAVGDVLRDQLFYLRRVGFSSFAVRADRSALDALEAFGDFSDVYQASVTPASAAFARRAAQELA